ncbi:MAG: archease [Myxococcales bacterium]|nr:archease [Myxococcales bacterium]
MDEARWEHFSHDADMGVRGIAPSLAAAFEQAALGLTAVVTDPSVIESHERVQLRCAADDTELLLYDWLNAIIYEMATRKLLFARFSVEVQDGELRATALGEPVDAARHQPAVEIKGATMTELAVRQRDDGSWLAQCVVDV